MATDPATGRPLPGAIATPGATAAQQPPDYTGPIDNTTTHKPTADGGYDVYDALGRFTYHQPPDQLNTVGKIGQGVLRAESSIPIVGPYLVQGGAGLANAIVPGSAAKAGVNSDGSVTPGYGTGNYGTPGAGGGGLPADAISDVQNAIANQQRLGQQFNTMGNNYQPTAAPVAASPAAIQAAIAGTQAPIQAGNAQAQYAQAAQIAQTVQAQQQAAIRAQQVNSPNLGPAALATQQAAIQAQMVPGAHIDPAAQAAYASIGRTMTGPTSLADQVNTAAQDQTREQQQQYIGGLNDTIAGKSPSVAEIMARNAMDRNIAGQYAMAAGASGMNTGLAQRTAMINAGNLNGDAIMQQALLRAQEIATARGQLGSALDSTRGQDLSLAGMQEQQSQFNAGAQNTSTLTQAQLDAARATNMAQLESGTSQFNAGQTNARATNQAQLSQAADIANQGANLSAQTTNNTLDQQVALANQAARNQTDQQRAIMQQQAMIANQGATLSADTSNASMWNQVNLANAAAGNATNTANAGFTQAANLNNSSLGTQASIANANNTTSANTSNATLANAIQIANANNATQANVTGATLANNTNIANANNAVSTNALNQKAQQDLYGNAIAASGQQGTTSVGYANTYAELAKAAAMKDAAKTQAGGALLAAAVA